MKQKNIERYTELLIHTVGWAFLLGLPFILADRNSGIRWTEIVRRLNGPVSALVVFYVNYLLWVPKFYLKGKTRSFVLFNIMLCLFGCMVMAYWEYLIRIVGQTTPPPVIYGRHCTPPPRMFFIMRDLVMQTLCIIMATTTRTSKEWRKAETARKEAELGRSEAELKNLRNQINPHFLLNTLNNIYALIQFNTEKAQEAVLDLGKLLRHVLYDNQNPYVPLAQEIDFLENYIRLMKIRLPEQVEITFEKRLPERHSLNIAPLLYISLIENAFKHGIRTDAPSFIHLTVDTVSESVLRLRLENSNYPKSRSDRSGSGIGLKQVQQRLDIIYPGKYQWTKGVDGSGKIYRSVLEIETNPQKQFL
ncbi:MAG: histidine kinase [Bacteroidales bacterium]|nr:histidine kinase [Bacteroidales bacterium]MCM1146412.1 histidine kinase [Bacteroidales bacterium]MCM1205150.1 histidine kinase [Bacillota bacterium]MCM1509397.1 histidine kinase [Clostridium sp.]